MKTSSKTGKVAKALSIRGEKHIILINSKGISITIPAESIRITGRAASGVRLMKVPQGSKIADARPLEDE